MHPMNMTLAGQCGKRTTMVRCHSYGGDVWPSPKPSPHIPRPRSMSKQDAHRATRTCRCSFVRFTCISHPRSSQHYAFASLYGCIWAFGLWDSNGRKAGISCAVPGAPGPNRHASLYNPYRCPLSAVSRAGMPFLKPDVTLGSTPTDERELIRPWAKALLVFFVDSKRRYTIPVPSGRIFFWNGLLARGEERCIRDVY